MWERGAKKKCEWKKDRIFTLVKSQSKSKIQRLRGEIWES